MTARDRDTLKTYYETGDIPTQVQFADFIDSVHNSVDDGAVGAVVGNSFVSAGVVVDSEGSILVQPTAATNSRYPVRMKWDTPASGNSMWPIYVEPLTPTELGVGTHGQGAFGIQLELTDFSGYYDCIYALGMHGDGTETVKNLQVWETGYNIGGGLLSNERYDKVRHPNATHWPGDRRMGWGYSTYDTNQGTQSGGVSFGFADMDAIDFRSSYANPANPSVGEFGTYHSIYPNYQTGALSVAWLSRQGTVQMDLQSGGTYFSSTKAITFESTGQLNLAIGTTVRSQVFNGAILHTLNATGLPTKLQVQSSDNDETAAVEIVARNSTTNTFVTVGTASGTYNYQYTFQQDKCYVMASNAQGLMLGSFDNEPIFFFQGSLGVTGGVTLAGDFYIRPNASVTPANNGDLTFEATSNTQVKIKYKGSDGTVRSTTLTLS